MAKTLKIFSGTINWTAPVTLSVPIFGYALPFGGTVDVDALINCRPAGTFSNLYLYVEFNDATGASTLRLRKNSANANQVISIAVASSGAFEDTTNTDTFADGDDVNLLLTIGGTNQLGVRTASILFDSATNTVSTLGAATITANFTTASATRYVQLSGDLTT